jgi:hypothetical protein
MRSSWAANVLLPTAQVLAEGAWLAVFYAALQALSGQPVWMGPLELAVMAWAGMAWGRRRRWRSPAAEALGLPILALAAGAFGWMLDPQVRLSLVQGDLLNGLGLHASGWITAIAFWRGEVHRTREDDDIIQDQLLRWAIPGLSIPWVLGHISSTGATELEFRSAAFVGTIFFIAAAFTAMGLARLEAVRSTTGSDWRANRSWLVLVLGMAAGIILLAIPAASFLGVPGRSLLGAMFGPLQTLVFVLILLATPIILLAAAVAEAIKPILPDEIDLGNITFPDFGADQRNLIPEAPTIIFYVIVGILLLLELIAVAGMLWLRWQERRRMRAATSDPFEERSIVIPPPDEPVRPAPRVTRRRRGDPRADPVDAYLAALDMLSRDGRWPRQPTESPAAHVARLRSAGEGDPPPGLARLAGAFQLVRYGRRHLTTTEVGRTRGRLSRLGTFLRRGG